MLPHVFVSGNRIRHQRYVCPSPSLPAAPAGWTSLARAIRTGSILLKARRLSRVSCCMGLERDSPTWPGSSVRGKKECTPVRQQGIRGCLLANGSFEGHTPQSCKGTGSAQKGLFNRRTHLREAGVSRRSSLFRPTSIFASTAPLRLATGINPPPSLGGKFCTSQGACPEGGPRFRRQRTKKKTYIIIR